jgi:hypothetical protein
MVHQKLLRNALVCVFINKVLKAVCVTQTVAVVTAVKTFKEPNKLNILNVILKIGSVNFISLFLIFKLKKSNLSLFL